MKKHKKVIAFVAIVFALIVGSAIITYLQKQEHTTQQEQAKQLLRSADYHHTDDRGNTNGDVFDYKAYLEDHGATDVKIAAYRNPDNGIQMWQLTWQKTWQGRPCTWSIYTENCAGTFNSYLECNVKDGQNYRTGADMGGEYIYDQMSAFSTTYGIYEEFRRVVEQAEEASSDCPLAACKNGHYVTDDAISFAVWHELGT